MNDLDLLRDYLRIGSEEAFASVVKRHLNLVYSAALRQVRSPELAEEVTQSVFVDLARQAGTLRPGTSVGAWLHQVTRRTAIDVVRRESRRRLREQAAGDLATMNTSEDWTHVAPLLDEAVDALGDTDRVAIVLRFFEQKTLAEIGAALGASEDAAQKRVTRAVDRLRTFFARHGVAVSAAGLGAALSANAVQAAPVGLLSAVIASGVSSAPVAAGAVAAVKTANLIAMTALQKAAVGSVIAACVAALVCQRHAIAELRGENESIRQQLNPLADGIERADRERDEATNRVAALSEENARLKSDAAEIVRLRGDLSRLKQGAAQAGADPGSGAGGSDPLFDSRSVLGRAALLKKLLREMPQKNIPEVSLLTDDEWLRLLQMGRRIGNLDTPDDIARALATVREIAKEKFAGRLGAAANSYAQANDGQLPGDISQLKPYLDAQKQTPDMDAMRYGGAPRPAQPYPPVDDAMLKRYNMVASGAVNSLRPGQPIIGENGPTDPHCDMLVQIGLQSFVAHGTGKLDGATTTSGDFDAQSLTAKQREQMEKARQQMEQATREHPM